VFKGKTATIPLHNVFADLTKKYGDPVTLWFGNKPCVLVSDYTLVKEIFQQNVFNSRQDSPTMSLTINGSQDIAMSKYGPLWQFHKYAPLFPFSIA
jgi:hypothetical protein